MNVIFTCGGTGGHINPAISVANLLKERMPGSRILLRAMSWRPSESPTSSGS